jgi:hypothetical protein
MAVGALRDTALPTEDLAQEPWRRSVRKRWAGIRQVGAEWHFPRARGHRCVMALLNGPGGSGSGGGYV